MINANSLRDGIQDCAGDNIGVGIEVLTVSD
jgi:hypothetical protein